MTDVLTYHNDNARTGQTLNEEILTPANVNTNQFGKLWMLPTDAQVRAEPLYAAGVFIPGVGERNVVIVATEGDSVYAFDADSTNMFWQVSMLGTNEQTADNPACFTTSFPQIGITATPVIDRQLGPNGTIFVEAMSRNSNSTAYYQRLHALDLATGIDRLAPVEITGSYPGNGDDSTNGTVIFSPHIYIERAAMLLVNGVVYVAFSAHCDMPPATSWVMGYDEYNLAQVSAVDLTPNGQLGSIWNSGAGPAADTNGNIYVTIGNGTFDNTFTARGYPITGDYGNCFVKLSTSNNILAVADYFGMCNIQSEIQADIDLASGAALVLPPMTDSNGTTRNLVVTAAKDQNIYLADTSNMGKFNPTNNNAMYQTLTTVFPGTNGGGPNGYGLAGGVWGAPAYFNGTLYFGPVSGPVTAFPLQNARLSVSSSQSPTLFGYPGSIPSVSANGSSNGIVWVSETLKTTDNTQLGLVTPAVLHAYAATNLAYELYNSSQATNSRDQLGPSVKFMTPMIASARVYVATATGVGVLGLLTQSVLTPLQQWRNTNFGNPSNVGAGANNASPAGDGVPNVIKYALGLNPFTRVQASQLASFSIQQVLGQSYLTLVANRNANPPDVSLVAAVSSDLQSWSSDPTNTTTLTNTASQIVILNNWPIGCGTNQFMRLGFQTPANQ
jgi:hypothetical protein